MRCRVGFCAAGAGHLKFAVAAAAKSGRELLDRVQYGVASVFELPVKDHSCQVVTNLFAPVCIPEYRRVLKRGGVLVFAVTSTRHLWELKSAIYDEPYENEKLDHQYEGFELVEKHKVNTVITLPNQQDIDNLFTMTPYYYKSSVESVERLPAGQFADADRCGYRRLQGPLAARWGRARLAKAWRKANILEKRA